MNNHSNHSAHAKQYFITATDTDAGKTYVGQLLVNALVKQAKRVAVYKPISAGCEQVDNNLVNEDANVLMQQANCEQSITQVNPIAFIEPIAPHIAAQKIGQQITIADIAKGFEQVKQLNADIIITEGAGGWRLPLGQGVFLSQFVQQSQMEVILVVNMKLGCLNHAMLTYQAIIADGLTCIGWVANCQTPMDYLPENLAELDNLIPAACLGILEYEADIDLATKNINISTLL